MVNLTISLSDEILKKIRKTVRERYGDKKGALSGLIEESVREKLDTFDAHQSLQTFRAMKGGRVIAESENLSTLAMRLREMKIDPRSVIIVSSRKIPRVARTGLRGRES